MSSVIDLATREERPPYVRFERRPVQNKPRSDAEGRWVGEDRDFVLITPAYTKDVIVREVDGWFAKLEGDRRNARIPDTWIPHYRRAYDAWKNGQEPPLDGMPIRGWSVISPAQQEMLVSLNIRTVEDLAQVTEDGIRRIGMGGVTLKNKAIAALKAAREQGPLVMENAELKAQLDLATKNVETLTEQVAALKAMVESGASARPAAFHVEPSAEISAAEILEDEPPAVAVETEPVRRGPGRPRKAA